MISLHFYDNRQCQRHLGKVIKWILVKDSLYSKIKVKRMHDNHTQGLDFPNGQTWTCGLLLLIVAVSVLCILKKCCRCATFDSKQHKQCSNDLNMVVFAVRVPRWDGAKVTICSSHRTMFRFPFCSITNMHYLHFFGQWDISVRCFIQGWISVRWIY